jgi:hypothetical protein
MEHAFQRVVQPGKHNNTNASALQTTDAFPVMTIIAPIVPGAHENRLQLGRSPINDQRIAC